MELKEIEKQLQEHTAYLEQERLVAQQTAMRDMAESLRLEAERRAEEKKAQEEANARAIKRATDKREVEAEQLRTEAEARRRIEQDADRKQEEIYKAMCAKEEIDRQVAEMERIADIAARQLEDAKNHIVVAEVIPEHPLKRFLQQVPE